MIIDPFLSTFLNQLIVAVSIIPIVYLAIFSIVFVVGYFYLIHLVVTNLLNKNYAEKVYFFAKLQKWFIYFELLVLGSLIYILLSGNSPIMFPILNATSSANLKDLIFIFNPITGSIVSFDNLSLVISVISILTIYLYFFRLLSKSKFYIEISGEQEKYLSIFWYPIIIYIIAGFLILEMDSRVSQSISNSPFVFDVLLGLLIIYNFIITILIPFTLKNNFFNYDKSEKFPKKDNYSYDFINSLSKLPVEKVQVEEEVILSITIILAILVYFFNCNIILFIMAESSILMAFFWSRQLQLIPNRKMTIELKQVDFKNEHVKIENVFIISESSKGYYVVLNQNNQVTSIMKDSIHDIIFQKNGEGP